MNRTNERGIALVLALLLTSAMSVVGMSLMFLSQTETYATMNYRMMSQARYAGEAGIHKAASFLLTASYTVPESGHPTDPLAAYDRTVSPVTFGGDPVVLSATPTVASNYPVAAVIAAFDAAAKGELAAGNTKLTYASYATLMSMEEFEAYGGGASVVQRWRITGVGGISGAAEATVEVTATIETPKVAANAYAAFATGTTCAAMNFHGNVTINSYDSASGPPATSTLSTGGNVGTNGNLTISGSVDVQGNLSTPRTGVGACDEGAVTALTESGTAEVDGSTIQLPTEVLYPAPDFSGVVVPTIPVTVNATSMLTPAALCASLGLVYAAPVTNADGTISPDPAVTNSSCTRSGTLLVVEGSGTDVVMPSVTMANGYTLRFVASNPPQTVYINSLDGNGNIEIQANMGATNANEAVVLKVKGLNADGSEMEEPFNLADMGWKQNATVNAASKYDASALQIVYGGSGTINMDGGNSQSAAVIYAPNADFILKGTQDLYGSILARTVTNEGNASLHYDRRLSRDFFVAGNPMASRFSWKRY